MADPVSIEATRLDLASDVLRGADPFVIEVVVPVITTTITEAGVEAARVQAVASVNGTATGVLTEIATAKADATGAVGAARAAATDAIDGARTAATGAIGTARSGSLVDIEDAREQALEDIQSAGQGSNSAIGVTFNPTGGISATNVQAALAEVDGEASKRGANLSDLADLALARQNLALRPGFEVQPYDADLAAIAGLTTVAFGRGFLELSDPAGARAKLALGSAALLTAGTSAGNALILDGGGKVPTTVIPESILGSVKYQGGWDASANSPALPAPSAANRGWYYIVTTAGTTSLTGPAGAITDWQVGDWAVSDGTYWEKVDSSDQVNSVAGLQGTITAPNLRTAIALAAIATSGSAADLTGTLAAARLPAFSGDATSTAGSAALTLANTAVTAQAYTGLHSVTFDAKGRATAAANVALAGDVTTTAGSLATTLTDGVVTFAKLAAAAVASVATDVWTNVASKLLTVRALWLSQIFVTLTDAATIAVDMSTFVNAKVTLGGNRTLGTPTNAKEGQSGYIQIIQDGTGSRTLAYAAGWDFGAALPPTLSTGAGKIDGISYVVINTTGPVVHAFFRKAA